MDRTRHPATVDDTLTPEELERYAAAADAAEQPAPITHGRVLRGADAANAGTALLREAIGSDELIEKEIRRGRKAIPSRRGQHAPAGTESPTVQFRLSKDDLAALNDIEQRTGKTRSELLRESVHLLMTHYTETTPEDIDRQFAALKDAVQNLFTVTADTEQLIHHYKHDPRP